MILLAIDPGNEQSAFVLYDTDSKNIYDKRILANGLLQGYMDDVVYDELVIEMIACYGMPVGKTVFETCVWIGRFIETAKKPFHFIYRKDEKMFLCGSMKAKDGNIRQALIDMFGGNDKAMGNKKAPGPLYGVSKDIWAALAVAVTYEGMRRK